MDADIAVDDALVHRLVRDQHPDLEGPLEPAAMGWDNAIYRLGARYAVRVPRRRVAAALVLNEQRWLAHLAPALPLPIPAPVRAGRPTPYYPWPWSITPWLPGTVVAETPVAPRASFAEQLAGFLTALHVPAPPDAPANPVRGVPLSTRPATRIPPHLRPLWNDLAAVPHWPGPPLWLHGDLHPANLLSTGGTLSAVLDFGDITAGDPATDLTAAWMVFDAPGRTRFRAALPNMDEDTWQRGRGWALTIASAVAADASGTPQMHEMAAHTLREVRLG
ncbi:aminoglycoside phosphotransferase family protein [Dactylosporangium sp. McL0621]|uniref:aminoglycoside phosphotransferase family protein n=1 Tax=Dactylosporangium sp. McL0621 TaxID=3415678 RepID=UPI003CF1C4E8